MAVDVAFAGKMAAGDLAQQLLGGAVDRGQPLTPLPPPSRFFGVPAGAASQAAIRAVAGSGTATTRRRNSMNAAAQHRQDHVHAFVRRHFLDQFQLTRAGAQSLRLHSLLGLRHSAKARKPTTMRACTRSFLVKDRPRAPVTLGGAERRLGLRKPDIPLPQQDRIGLLSVGAQEIRALLPVRICPASSRLLTRSPTARPPAPRFTSVTTIAATAGYLPGCRPIRRPTVSWSACGARRDHAPILINSSVSRSLRRASIALYLFRPDAVAA